MEDCNQYNKSIVSGLMWRGILPQLQMFSEIKHQPVSLIPEWVITNPFL